MINNSSVKVGAGCGRWLEGRAPIIGPTLGSVIGSVTRLAIGVAVFTGCGNSDDAPQLASASEALTSLRIEAESFDRYYDTDTTHHGDCGSGPVDAEITLDPNGGQCHVGWTEPGEWLEYDVNIPQGGEHTFVFRLASEQANRRIRLEVDGVNVTGSVTSPFAGWQSFADRTVANVPLTAGAHVFRVVFETGAVNLNYFDVIQTSGADEVIVDADFTDGTGGFSYYDQSAWDYVDGDWQDGRLSMTLGGIDNQEVIDLRGAFTRLFWVSQYQEVTLKFDYWLEQSCHYESDEQSELRATLDGVPLTTGNAPYIARVVGNGDGCPGAATNGTYVKTVALNPGKHHLEIVGFNNKKNAQDEVTTLHVDNVLITASANQCTPAMSSAYQKLCNACDGFLDCQGSCTVAFPSNVGAACGSCGGVVQCDGSCSKPLNAPCGPSPTVVERHQACAKDPRVVADLVPQDICTGADVFFRETFDGNGRTCASCHPVTNNYTIDPPYVQALFDSNPNDPLFVAKPGTPLEKLETSELLSRAMVLENIDGFQDPENRFVSRSVPHLFSLAITIDPDPADGSTNPPVHRTGWGGDGAPGDGSLRSFLDGAIKQHFTKRLVRVPGVDFREANEFEKDVVESFQLSLGRQNELDLASVQFALEMAQGGKTRFLDPAQGRCGVCHANAGANFIKTGLNRGFNNGSPGAEVLGVLFDYPAPGQQLLLSDGGFGGADLLLPNIDTNGLGMPNGFGDNNFSVPSLVEAADTAPFFHGNFSEGAFGTSPLDRIVFFYGGVRFSGSSGAQFLETFPEFGPTNIDATTTQGIAPMLVVLNAVFNIDLARQRLDAAAKLAQDLRHIRADVQVELMLLAGEEIEDAIRVLQEQNIHATERGTLQTILNQVRQGDVNAAWSARRADILAAMSALNSVRAQFGSNFDYQLGVGTLMY